MAFHCFDFRVDAKERFLLVETFLKKWQLLWQPSAFGSYPEPLKNVPESWAQYLKTASEVNLFQLSNYKCTGKGLPKGLPSDLKKLVEEIRDLIDFPFYHHDQQLLESDPIYEQQINRLNLKKSHELRNLGPLLKDLSDDLQAESLVEVGGGKGFLSLAASSCRANHIIIDMQEELLQKCRGYFERWNRNKSLTTIVKTIDRGDFQADCQIPSKSVLAGLHLCGNLSVFFLDSIVKNRNLGVLSLGCCYHRLEECDQNLSGLCQLHLGASEYRLALAPYHYKCVETYRNNVIKNIYRFALFCLYHQVNGKLPVMKILNDYEYPHRAKALEFEAFLHLNYEHFKLPISIAEAMKMYQGGMEELAISMERFEFVRRIFSRVVEVYLILDRVLYLEKNHFDATIVQLFDGRISPRNLGVIGKRASTQV